MDSNNWAAHKNLGTALQKAGRYQEAIESFETALRLNPSAIDTYNDLANCYVRLNDRSKANAMLQRGLEQARAAGDEVNSKKFSDKLDAK